VTLLPDLSALHDMGLRAGQMGYARHCRLKSLIAHPIISASLPYKEQTERSDMSFIASVKG